MKADVYKAPFFVFSCANATPEFEGHGGEELAESLSSTMAKVYTSPGCLDLKSLCLVKREQCWLLNVDILVSEKRNF